MQIRRLSYDAIMSSFSRTLDRLDHFIEQQRDDKRLAEVDRDLAAATVALADQNIVKASATRSKIAALIGAGPTE